MIEIIKQRLSTLETREAKYAALREYLQLLILKIIENKGYFKNIAFLLILNPYFELLIKTSIDLIN